MKHCMVCLHVMPEHARFCGRCGASLTRTHSHSSRPSFSQVLNEVHIPASSHTIKAAAVPAIEPVRSNSQPHPYFDADYLTVVKDLPATPDDKAEFQSIRNPMLEGGNRSHISTSPVMNVDMSDLRQKLTLQKTDTVVKGKKRKLKANTVVKKMGYYSLILMISLIGIFYGPVLFAQFTHTSPTSASVNTHNDPVLTVASNGNIIRGTTFEISGANFPANTWLTFILDNNGPVNYFSGAPFVVLTDSQGNFDASIPVGEDWADGSHTITVQAHDVQSKATFIVQGS